MTALALLAVLAAPADRPNFVVVLTDDQRWDALGCVQAEQGERGRFPFLRTPHLDKLAASGARFRNAFVTCALCSPSRAAFLTGRYPHANGIVNNGTPFPPDAVTHASLLRAAGYRTGYVGKWHMGTQPDRPGFDWPASYTGQGLYEAAKFRVNGTVVSKPGWVDDQSAAYGVQFLEESKDKPFLLVVGLKSAHGPFEPPARLKGAYAGEQARRVPNYGVRPGFNPTAAAPTFPAGPTVPVNLGYLRCLTGADEAVGTLLAALDRLKLAENTAVVFASDNGFYLGEHALADKRSAYDESVRIPLLVRYPKAVRPGTVIDGLALNVDLAPTLLDLAGLPVPAGMHGRSWRPLFAGGATDWRRSFLYEYFHESGGKDTRPQGVGGYNTPTLTAVRTDTAKLVRYAGHPDWTEVFDLSADPYELTNRATDPAAADLRKSLEAEHDRLAAAVGYAVPPARPRKSP
jgi:arylsulfatase A-like enzyme